MKMKLRGRSVAFVALGLLLGSAGLSQASIVDFQTTVQANTDLTNSYTFDGSPLLDSKGTDNLSNVGAVAYGAGYGTSSAVETSAGNALRSFSHPLALSHTVEYIFKTDDQTAGGFVAAAFTGSSRLYYGKQGTGKLDLVIGPNVSKTIIDTADYNDNDWYYVAVSVEQVGTDWVTNAWFANLTGGDTSLTQSVTGYTVAASGLPGTPALGIGAGPFGSTAFDGSIDDLNVYGAALSGATLQGHLTAINAVAPVPEPSSCVLLIGMAGFLFNRRRRR